VKNILYLGVLLLTPLAVGGVHSEVALVIAAIGVCLLAGEYWTESREYVFASLPSMAFWLGALVCLFQVVPLPRDLVAFLSPHASGLFHDGWLGMFGESSGLGWQSLSMGPARTAGWGARWLAMGVMAALTIRRANRRHAVRNLLRVVAASGLLVLAMGVVQTLAGADRILFLYEPEADIRRYTTFVSTNHAAVFYFLGGLSALGLAGDRGREHLGECVGAGVTFVVLVGAGFQCQSLASVIAFFAMLVVFTVLLVARDPGADARYSSYVLYGFGAGLGLVVVGFAGQMVGLFPATIERWIAEVFPLLSWSEWKHDLAVRLELVRAGFRAIPDFWRLGAGAGATEYILAPYIDWSQIRPATVPTVENEPLEWLLHYGVFVGPTLGLLLGTYLVFGATRFAARMRLRYAIGASVALFAAIVAQFHFPLVALGIVVPLVCLLEIALFPVRRSERDAGTTTATALLKRGVVRLPVSVARWGVVAAAGALALFAVISHESSIDLPESGEEASEMTSEELQRLVRLTPSDGDVFVFGVSKALREGDIETAVRRAEYGYEVEPTANMGIVLARAYREAGRTEEAVRTYRRVFSDRFDRVPHEWLSGELVPDLKRPELVARALVEADPDHWRVAARTLVDARGPSAAASFGLELVELLPDEPRGYVVTIKNYLRMEHYALAEMWARRLLERDLQTPEGGRPAGYGLLIRVLEKQGREGRAREVAVEAMRKVPESEDVAIRVASVVTEKTEAPTEGEVRAVADAMPLVCRHRGKPWRKSLCWRAEAWLAEQRGDTTGARYAYRRIAEKLDRPRRYLAFLARQRRCDELSEFLAERRSSKERDFSGYLERCLGD
jgi:hypothetical protein